MRRDEVGYEMGMVTVGYEKGQGRMRRVRESRWCDSSSYQCEGTQF